MYRDSRNAYMLCILNHSLHSRLRWYACCERFPKFFLIIFLNGPLMSMKKESIFKIILQSPVFEKKNFEIHPISIIFRVSAISEITWHSEMRFHKKYSHYIDKFWHSSSLEYIFWYLMHKKILFLFLVENMIFFQNMFFAIIRYCIKL